MRKLLSRALVVAATLAISQQSFAAERTRIATAFEEDNRFDIYFGVGYEYAFEQASILREWNRGGDGDRTELVRDLVYRHQRHTLNPKVEIGLWHDLAVYAELPIVVHDTRDFSFDQRADDCVYGQDLSAPGEAATCVNAANSTTLRDEILPRGGIDATHTSPFDQFDAPGTERIFRGPTRRGLDQLHVGLKYGILDQAKRKELPTWVIAAEGRFAVGRAMTLSRDFGDNPQGNRRVGRRIHELGLWTAISHRFQFVDPFFSAYWRQSIRASGSKFQDFSDRGAQEVILPQSHAGATMGAEFIPFERKARHLEVAILVSGRADLHYGGRGYSEIWELLADSPALVGSYDPTTQALDDAGSPTQSDDCDRDAALAHARNDPGDPGYLDAGGASCQRFEGLSDIENYATFGLDLGVNVRVGKYVRLSLTGQVQTDTAHFLTNTDRGDADRPGSGGEDPGRVEPGTTEVNPLRRDVVDDTGRRYAIDDVVQALGQFQVLITF